MQKSLAVNLHFDFFQWHCNVSLLANKPRQWKSMLTHQGWFNLLIYATLTGTTNYRVCNLQIYLYPCSAPSQHFSVSESAMHNLFGILRLIPQATIDPPEIPKLKFVLVYCLPPSGGKHLVWNWDTLYPGSGLMPRIPLLTYDVSTRRRELTLTSCPPFLSIYINLGIVGMSHYGESLVLFITGDYT